MDKDLGHLVILDNSLTTEEKLKRKNKNNSKKKKKKDLEVKNVKK